MCTRSVPYELGSNGPFSSNRPSWSVNFVRVTWTQNHDDDFAAYEISVSGGSEPHVFLVRDASQTSLSVDAAPATSYAVQVTVVDQAGQRARSNPSTVTTPDPPPPSPAQIVQSPFSFLLVAGAVVAGFGADRALRQSRGRRGGPDVAALAPGRVLALPPPPVEVENALAASQVVDAQVAMLASAFVAGRMDRELLLLNLEKLRRNDGGAS